MVESENGVKVIGYSDLPSRLPGASSNLYGNNIAKLLLSLKPTATEENSSVESSTARIILFLLCNY